MADCPRSLLASHRVFLRQGNLQRAQSKKACMLVLFNDVLLYCHRSPLSGKAKYVRTVKLATSVVRLAEGMADCFQLLTLNKNYLFRAKNPNHSKSWVKDIVNATRNWISLNPELKSILLLTLHHTHAHHHTHTHTHTITPSHHTVTFTHTHTIAHHHTHTHHHTPSHTITHHHTHTPSHTHHHTPSHTITHTHHHTHTITHHHTHTHTHTINTHADDFHLFLVVGV